MPFEAADAGGLVRGFLGEHGAGALDAGGLAAACRTALRDLLIADRSRVETTPERDGGFLVSVTNDPGPS